MVEPHTHLEINSRFEWGPVVAGSLVALAITIVLVQFGIAIGYSSDIDFENRDVTHWTLIAMGLWVLLVQLVSSFAGGYVTGYMRSVTPDVPAHENEMRNGLYGLSTWALATVAVFIGVSLAAAVTAVTAVSNDVVSTAQDMTDAEQNAAIISAFAVGAISFVAAAASWFAAVMGGHHRLTKFDFAGKYTFLK